MASSLVPGIQRPDPVLQPSETPQPTPTVGEVSVTPASARPIGLASAVGPPYEGLPANARLRIPNLKIDAPIVPVGLTAEGEVEPPPGPEYVGWYNLSPIPGSPGNSILAGHVDWKNQTAVFWDLRRIKPGDTIYVGSSDRADVLYTVEWIERYKPEEAPIDRIFASLYEPTLTIITCEGVFDQTTRNYSLRLVVRARRMS